jgi:hypothetical protein
MANTPASYSGGLVFKDGGAEKHRSRRKRISTSSGVLVFDNLQYMREKR